MGGRNRNDPLHVSSLPHECLPGCQVTSEHNLFILIRPESKCIFYDVVLFTVIIELNQL